MPDTNPDRALTVAHPTIPPTVVEVDDDLHITINANAVEPGSYLGELVDLVKFSYDSEDGERTLLRWTFVLPDQDDALVEGVSSLNTGARSKAFSWLSVLMGPAAVATPRAVIKRSELLGRRAIVVVTIDDNGFSKVDRLAPLPKPKAAA